eukprot:1912290-Lingulodinium_polyedra.AAC.1
MPPATRPGSPSAGMQRPTWVAARPPLSARMPTNPYPTSGISTGRSSPSSYGEEGCEMGHGWTRQPWTA